MAFISVSKILGFQLQESVESKLGRNLWIVLRTGISVSERSEMCTQLIFMFKPDSDPPLLPGIPDRSGQA